MYTWGSSPQALRLANQIKRRANAKQKSEEHQRREMSKRFEATIINPEAATTSSAAAAASELSASSAASLADAALSSAAIAVPAVTVTPPALNTATEDKSAPVASIVREKITQYTSDTEVVGSSQKISSSSVPLRENVDAIAADINMQIIADVVAEIPSAKNEEIVQEQTEHKPLEPINPPTATAANATTAQSLASAEIDPCEHMSPHQVDTSEVAGQILQVNVKAFASSIWF